MRPFQVAADQSLLRFASGLGQVLPRAAWRESMDGTLHEAEADASMQCNWRRIWLTSPLQSSAPLIPADRLGVRGRASSRPVRFAFCSEPERARASQSPEPRPARWTPSQGTDNFGAPLLAAGRKEKKHRKEKRPVVSRRIASARAKDNTRNQGRKESSRKMGGGNVSPLSRPVPDSPATEMPKTQI